MADEALRFEVTPSLDGAPIRLDRFVVDRLEASGQRTSRTEVQRWIRSGNVTVDGSEARPGDVLTPGSTVVVNPMGPRLSSAAPDPGVAFVVVYEDEALLVVDKPPHLVVHPAKGHERGTLVNGLLARPGFAAENADARDPEAHLRPGIVHRIDKGTSGLLVVAKTPAAREGLKALFDTHDIEREYVAIAVGDVHSATFDTLHGRHPADRKRFTSRVKDGKRAVTHVERIRPLDRATLVRCRLETGRTHQIRVHLAECARAPLLGDATYGRKPRFEPHRTLARELDRAALHARVLGFRHPISGEELHFEAELPADFERVLTALSGPSSPT